MIFFKLYLSCPWPHSSGIFHLRVPESASVGSAVGRIQAHDLDAGSNAEVDYAIVPGDEGNMFDIFSDGKSQDGVVVLKKVHSLIIKCIVTVYSTYGGLRQLVMHDEGTMD